MANNDISPGPPQVPLWRIMVQFLVDISIAFVLLLVLAGGLFFLLVWLMPQW